jgi:hypothetical protein
MTDLLLDFILVFATVGLLWLVLAVGCALALSSKLDDGEE